jgi:hypothetical protein
MDINVEENTNSEKTTTEVTDRKIGTPTKIRANLVV